STERDHVGLAVQENLFDVVLNVSIFDSGLPVFKLGVHFSCHVAHADYSLEKIMVRTRRLVGHSHMVSLYIEDEESSPVLGHGCGFKQFGSIHPEEMAEHRVHGGKGERHPAGGAQKSTAVDP